MWRRLVRSNPLAVFCIHIVCNMSLYVHKYLGRLGYELTHLQHVYHTRWLLLRDLYIYALFPSLSPISSPRVLCGQLHSISRQSISPSPRSVALSWLSNRTIYCKAATAVCSILCIYLRPRCNYRPIYYVQRFSVNKLYTDLIYRVYLYI